MCNILTTPPCCSQKTANCDTAQLLGVSSLSEPKLTPCLPTRLRRGVPSFWVFLVIRPNPILHFAPFLSTHFFPCLNPIFKNGSFLSVVALVFVTLLVSNPSSLTGKPAMPPQEHCSCPPLGFQQKGRLKVQSLGCLGCLGCLGLMFGVFRVFGVFGVGF